MRRWERIRLSLRVVGAMTGVCVPFAGGGLFSALLAAVAAGATALSVDLPRDAWTPKQLEAYRRTRRPTRPNPLTEPKR